MKDTTHLLLALAKDLAAQLSMPDLATATPNENGELKTNIALTGQSLALFSRMDATLSLHEQGHLEGAYVATLRLSYDHPAGGSNGNNREWLVNTEPKYGRVEYAGAVPMETFRSLLSKVRQADAEREKAAQA